MKLFCEAAILCVCVTTTFMTRENKGKNYFTKAAFDIQSIDVKELSWRYTLVASLDHNPIKFPLYKYSLRLLMFT